MGLEGVESGLGIEAALSDKKDYQATPEATRPTQEQQTRVVREAAKIIVPSFFEELRELKTTVKESKAFQVYREIDWYLRVASSGDPLGPEALIIRGGWLGLPGNVNNEGLSYNIQANPFERIPKEQVQIMTSRIEVKRREIRMQTANLPSEMVNFGLSDISANDIAQAYDYQRYLNTTKELEADHRGKDIQELITFRNLKTSIENAAFNATGGRIGYPESRRVQVEMVVDKIRAKNQKVKNFSAEPKMSPKPSSSLAPQTSS